MKVIGLMSGTSVDGIDAVLVELPDRAENSGTGGVNVVAFETSPYPADLRLRLLDISQPGRGKVEEICHVNAYLGELFAAAAISVAAHAGVALDEIDLIGSHGHTIQHRPTPLREREIRVTSTLQIGEPSIIAERTGVTTIADFRPRDMAAGGEGAPLAPYGHYLLFHHPEKTRIVTNIGGISNLTYLPAGGTPAQVIAFDTGPGNMLIDQIITRMTDGALAFDTDGQHAAQGTCREDLLAWMMQHPYLERRPPKSTGREEFGDAHVRQLCQQADHLGVSERDLLRTATDFTAASIVSSYQAFLPIFQHQAEPRVEGVEVLVCGGGVKNTTLMRALQQRLAPIPIVAVEAVGLSSDALEAIVFALLARETYLGRPANLPAVTGATHPVLLGKIVPGAGFQGLHWN
ncbi:anhydro-N-acetylmuramic acid kinase [candidate division KSB3 bacterium]|uniref:Anhydro-N-acetylmuramic acid kinase n=1 Tax=candidate division KSB3 bacterium TaxID=2044937 RepID=A0A9D5JVY7_9BACT|nr:anhydro-N-acetylmuramic acid kinase [candidate division KSB3 bacterium]MBD3325129.1 anhydro-N-acetylmuramic acid kinase [candidate division KSB3 bacterium]